MVSLFTNKNIKKCDLFYIHLFNLPDILGYVSTSFATFSPIHPVVLILCNRYSHLSCEYLQLFQSYSDPLGCFPD